jgi:hypothetical protein
VLQNWDEEEGKQESGSAEETEEHVKGAAY